MPQIPSGGKSRVIRVFPETSARGPSVVSGDSSSIRDKATMRRYRVACLVDHPIQYFAPLFQRLSGLPQIDLKVYFLSDVSLSHYYDTGFGVRVKWDVPLLEGYRYEFLPSLLPFDPQASFWKPLSYGITRRLRRGSCDALMVHGYAHNATLRAIAAAKMNGIKVLVRGESNLISRRLTGPKEWLRDRVLRNLFSIVDGFLAIGTHNREFYRHYGAPERKIFMMPYAVDNEFFQAGAREAQTYREQLRADLGLERHRPVILFASKLQQRKHPDHLLEAYARLSPDGKQEPRPYLVFVGEGELRHRIEQRVAELGWKTIKMLGFKNQSELPRYYDLCDVFVLPSRGEPWGLVINEVMNAGKPVITTDQVGASADLVRDGENGYVVAAGDIEALSKRLRILTTVPGLAATMGEKSSRRIETWGLNEAAAGLLEGLTTAVGSG
jgi:glycosyltransferase involved in cell wall biosynthesis